MDYQLTQTGAQVQEILNDAPITQQDLEAVEALLPEGVSTGNKLVDYNQMNTLLQAKQDKLTEQTTGTKIGDLSVKYGVNIGYGVTVGSDNQTKVTITPGSITKGQGANIFDAMATIEAVIPSAASGLNKLTDKNYVDSAIATSSANFVGTFESLAELQAVQNPTNNDYGFVIETDAQGNEYYDRYKFNGTQWLFEYKVESTPFTADQWASIQSGITSALVTKLNALPTAQQLNTQLAGKQDTITDLAAIRSGSAAGATAAANTGDKAYDAAAFSGLGRVNLPKNITTVGGTEKNVLSQAMVNTANTIYVIQYDYDLNGQTITLPANVTLQFDGGSLANGTLKGSNTIIDSVNVAFKKDLTIQGTWKNEVVYSRWFEFISSEDGVTDNSLQFKQLQAVINGTHGCRVEFIKGYYQTQIIGMEPEAYVEINGVTYPKWAMNTYQKDNRIVLHILEIPYVDINLNGSTIQGINITCPGWCMVHFDGVDSACIHDGTLIGMAINNFSYPEYANYNWQALQAPVNNYEFAGLLFFDGGFATAYNMTTKYATGDGITAGSAGWYFRVGDIRDGVEVTTAELVRYHSTGYRIEDCEVCYCGRNGITMHSSDAATLKNCHIHHIGSDAGNAEIGTDGIQGRSPRAGIDVEFEDGQGWKPIVEWNGLYIHDCGEKSFGFATPNLSTMKQFDANNCRFIGLGLPNNITAEGEKSFNNCYFEHIGKAGTLLGNPTYNNCTFIVKALGLSVGACTFNNCTIMDEYDGEDTTTQFFNQSLSLRIFRNCTLTIRHRTGYISNNTFYGCTLNFYAKYYVPSAGAEFYDCTFNNDPDDDSIYSFAFSAGNNAASTRKTLKLVRCSFDKARGYGNSVSDFFFNMGATCPIYVDGCTFNRLQFYHGSSNPNIIIKNCTIENFNLAGYNQSASGVEPFKMENCTVSNFNTYTNAKEAIISNCNLGITAVADGWYSKLRYVLLRNCYVTNYATRPSGWADGNVRAIGSTFDFVASTPTTAFNLENCYIKGLVTEATFAGTKNACSFETPLPASGTTAQRPSASVAGVGFKFFDTDLNSPVYSNGTNWVLSANGGEDEIDHGTSDTTFALTSNVLHKWGEVAALTLTLAAGTSGKINEYMFQFTSGTTPTVLTVPNTVSWVSAPNIEANTTYQASIVNNIGVIVGV